VRGCTRESSRRFCVRRSSFVPFRLVVSCPPAQVPAGGVVGQTITNRPVCSLRYAIIAAPRTPWSR
jgi:hypothetical protein